MDRGVVMEPVQGKLASSQFDFGYNEQFCIPEPVTLPQGKLFQGVKLAKSRPPEVHKARKSSATLARF